MPTDSQGVRSRPVTRSKASTSKSGSEPAPGISDDITSSRRTQPSRAKPTRVAVPPTAAINAINPTSSKRLLVTFCFPLFFLLCVPWWWYTTSIEKLPLPVDRVSALEQARGVHIRTSVLFTADDDAFPRAPADRADFPKSVKLEALAKEVTKGVDGILGRSKPADRGERRWDLEVKSTSKSPLRVHIRHTESANSSFPLEPYVQQPYAVTGSEDLPAGTLVIPVHPSQMDDRNLRQHYKIALINGIHNLLPPNVPEIPNRALAYKPNITLSFILLNEDSSEGSYVDGWDIEDALRDHFQPHLETLAPVFNFSIESQVLYQAPLTFEPEEDGGQSIIDEDHLKVFVSERWSLDSQSSNNPVLRFMVFVPSPRHRPMHIGVEDSSDAFLIPQFGSAVILNPPSSVRDDQAYHLSQSALDGVFNQFTSDFYSLLAIPTLPRQLHPCPRAGTTTKTATDRTRRGIVDPLTPWQLDTLLRMRLKENTAEAKQTLAGIVRLVAKIKEMKVGEGVRNKVIGAVRRLEGLPAAARSKSPLPAFILSRDAVQLANDAFFDPSMMGLLYFPDQHKFAVYTPLFGPIVFSMLLGLLREVGAWKKRRKARAEANKAEKAKGAKPSAAKTSAQ